MDDPELDQDERLRRLAALIQTWLGDFENLELMQSFMETIPQERQASLRVIGLVSILFGTLMAVLFAGRISRPITEVARAAERFARGDLAVRASLPARQERAHDEVSLLIQNFNAMAASLARLERERKAMIADIAHELRTPLTILQGRLEGIEDGVVPLTLRKSISSTGR